MIHEGMIVRFSGTDNTEPVFTINERMRLLAQYGAYGEIYKYNINDPQRLRVQSLSQVPGYADIFSWHLGDVGILEDMNGEMYNLIAEEQRGIDEAILIGDPDKIPERKGTDYNILTDKLALLNTTPFEEIDYLTPQKEMRVGYSIVKKGNIIDNVLRAVSFDKVSDNRKLFRQDTAPYDLLIFTPVDWCNYMGYSTDIAERWVKFINSFRLSYKVFLKFGALPQNEHSPVILSRFNNYFIRSNNYYVFLLQETEIRPLHKLYYELVSQLHLYPDNNIPGLLLQLQDKTPLSNWQLFLLGRGFSPTSTPFPSVKGHTLIPVILGEENHPQKFLRRLLSTNEIDEAISSIYIPNEYHKKLIDILRSKDTDKLMEWIKGTEAQKYELPKEKEKNKKIKDKVYPILDNFDDEEE